MQDNVTPEEKLLNLIKKNPETVKDTEREQLKKKEPIVESVPEVKLGAPKGNKVKAKGIPPRKIGIVKVTPLSIFNKFLIILLFCALAYMLFVYMHIYKSKNRISEKFEGRETGSVTESVPKTSPPLSYYTDILGKRQMFKIYETPKPKPTGPPKPKVTLQQLLGGYTFVGIIFGDVPQAIVEERRTSQSFYLVAGQFLGEIKIEKIESGKVTVSYEGETMDISI